MRIKSAVTFAAFIVSSLAVVTPGQAQPAAMKNEAAASAARAQQLQQVERDPVGYAAALVARFESEARALGRWDAMAGNDLLNALAKMAPEQLLLAGEATSYKGLMQVVATGRLIQAPAPADVQVTSIEQRLGDSAIDLVFTPVTPCRIADTRSGGGAIGASGVRTFDVDGTNLAGQGGSATGCGLPFGVPAAAVLTFTVVQPAGQGYLTAYGLSATPLAATMTYAANDILSTTTIVPVLPGAGADFSVYSWATTEVVIDVVGYYAAPAATPLDCVVVTSATTSVPVNAWTAVDVACPVGRTATGGGTLPQEGTLGWPGVWTTTTPISGGWRTWVDNQTGGARSLQTWAQCCRVPGR